MARYIDGDKLMEHWQEWDWWDNKGMPHSQHRHTDATVYTCILDYG